jgi:antitoxin component YwqK of YwqJK toxin-antitoxin module
MRILKITTLFVLALSLHSCNRSNNYGPIVEETYVHRYGVAVPPEDWTEKGQSGKVITTLKNGVVVSKSIASGILEGETTYSFPHSEVIQKVESYSQGTLKRFVVYYYSGKPAHEVVLNDNSRQITRWYENGVPQSLERIANDKLLSGEYFTVKNQQEAQVIDGKGTRIQRDHYGQHVSTDTIQNGEMVLCTTCHSNGAPKELTPYRNRVVEGELKSYLPAGEPNTTEMWVGGKKEGITIVYQNGEKFAEVPYISGTKQGVERRYRDGHHVIEEISWVNDQRHGPSYAYIGDVIKTDWYYQGRLVTEKTFELLDHGKTRS